MYAGSGLNGLVTGINNCRHDVYTKMTLMLMKRQFLFIITNISHIMGAKND